MFSVLFFLYSLAGIIAASNCPSGSVASLSNVNRCFYFGIQKLSYLNAKWKCRDLNGHLATSFNINLDLNLNFRRETNDFWFGLNAIDGKWAWQDGSELNFTYWDSTEPNNQTDNICGAISLSNGKWSAQKCFSLKPYICEFFVKETTTNLTNPLTIQEKIYERLLKTTTCSETFEMSCGDRLKKRAQRVCSVPQSLLINKIALNYCPISTLAKMCCEKQCSDCGIKECACPDIF